MAALGPDGLACKGISTQHYPPIMSYHSYAMVNISATSDMHVSPSSSDMTALVFLRYSGIKSCCICILAPAILITITSRLSAVRSSVRNLVFGNVFTPRADMRLAVTYQFRNKWVIRATSYQVRRSCLGQLGWLGRKSHWKTRDLVERFPP